MVFSEKYTKPEYRNRPDEYKDPRTKPTDKELYRKKGEWLYHLWLTDYGVVPFSRINDFRTFRLYMQGNQPNHKYSKQLDIELKKGPGDRTARKSWVNFSRDIYSIAPKFMNYIEGLFANADFAIEAFALDELADDMREQLKFSVWAEAKQASFFKVFDALAGTASPNTPQLPFQPNTMEEMEMLSTMGSFKLGEEMAIEMGLKKSEELSDWQMLKIKLIRDAVSLGCIAGKDYTEAGTGEIKTSYVDPENFIGISMNPHEPEKITDGAEIKACTLEQLLQMGMDRKNVDKIASTYQGKYGNVAIQKWGNDQYYRLDDYSRIKIWYLDADVENLDSFMYEFRSLSGQEEKVPFTLPFDKEVKERSNRGYEKATFNRRLRFKWVIGTGDEGLWDYGYQYNVPYDQTDQPVCSYTYYEIAKRSIGSLLVPVLDDLQMTVLTFRRAWNQASPPGLEIEFGSLSEITLFGKTLDPHEVLQIRQQTGNLLRKDPKNPMNGGMPMQGGQPPIRDLQGGLGNYFNEFKEKLIIHTSQVQELLGIANTTAGGDPSADQPVGTSKISQLGTNYVLQSILNGYKWFKKTAYSKMANRWQIQLWALDLSDNAPNFADGMNMVYKEMLKNSKNISLMHLGIFISAVVDTEFKQRIQLLVDTSLAAAKTGAVGITPRDAFFIERLLNTGQLKIAYSYLAYREMQEHVKQQQIQQQNIQLNAQTAQQTEDVKNKGKIAVMNAKTEGEIKVLQTEFMLEIKKLQIIKAMGITATGADASPPPPPVAKAAAA